MRDTEHGVYVKEKVAQSRSYLQEELKKLGCKVYDSQTNFIFFDPLVDPVELSMKMMEKGIMISAQAGASRVSVHTMEMCELFIRYLTEILQDLRK